MLLRWLFSMDFVTAVDQQKRTMRFIVDEATQLEMQVTLLAAYRCAWNSLVPLWVEQAIADERSFPEIDLVALEQSSQRSVYLDGLAYQIAEMLKDLGVSNSEGKLDMLVGHYLGAPCEVWSRPKLETLIEFNVAGRN